MAMPGPSEGSDALEQRITAFAEQLGRIAGTIQGRAESLMERQALNSQIARIRDGAAQLLQQLAGTDTPAPAKSAGRKAPRPATRRAAAGRSGGTVDAPGKKRRKAPPNPDAHVPASQAAKLRAARTMEKTKRHRGRG